MARAAHALGSEHAVKLLQAPSAEVASRLLREGRVQARLRHPNIVPVTDLVQSEERVALVMEYIAGGTPLSGPSEGGDGP
ncbi:MAG: protein kinase [Deltaproteobacteria bacterium]|nr:protein kinase [Deltaproteobacteria bacterium]